MSGVANPRAVVPTLTDGMLAEVARILDGCESGAPQLPKRERRNNRCPHGFIDHGAGLCWECDPAVRHQTKVQALASLRRVGL